MRRRTTIPAALLLLATSLASPAPATAADCPDEAATLVKDEAELPRLEIASPKDRPVLCITLETVMAFAGRLKAHVTHCPNSSYAASAADWERTRADYLKRFAQNRCRRTIF
jgi:hypothetical protein